jgi:serine/threonine protein kinase
LSQFIPPDQKIKDKQNAKGTPLWMAPEVMSFREFNEKCDIYSFGIGKIVFLLIFNVIFFHYLFFVFFFSVMGNVNKRRAICRIYKL